MSDLHYPSTGGTSEPSMKESVSAVIPRWIQKIIGSPRMLWLGPILGFLLAVPSFFSGYSLDDHILRQQTMPNTEFVKRQAWDCFNWIAGDGEVSSYREKGIWVGWHDPDGVRLRLFRPLASMLHIQLFRFFDASPWVMHAGLALLYGLLILFCARLFARISTAPAALGIAILLFTLDYRHALSVGWISAYNTMLSPVFGMLALLMHDRWRRKKTISGPLQFAVYFLLALLSSEGGLALMGFLLAYAIFIERGSLLDKAASLFPGGIIAAGYVVFYFAGGFGAKNWWGGYVSPPHDPLMSLIALVNNTLVFSMSQLIPIPQFTMRVQALSIPLGAICAAGILAGFVYLFRRFLLSNKIAAFFGCAMILSIVPFTIGLMRDQLLLWAGIGAAGLFGELFTAPAAVTGVLQRLAARTLLFSNIVFPALFFIPMLSNANSTAESIPRLLEKAIPSGNTVFLNTAGPQYFVYAAAIRFENGGEWPRHCYTLYFGDEDSVTLQRTGDRTLRVEAARGWFRGAFMQMMQQRKFPDGEGDVVDLELMKVTIEKVSPDHLPLAVSFTFKKDLSEFSWMKWTGEGPVPCEVPLPGQAVRLFGAP